MPTPYQTPIGSFTRKTTFFWAAVGATVGLANLWQFPYLASLHGGGLFILLYLGCLLLVTLPLMVTEATLGRYSRHGIVLAMDGYIRSAKVSGAWMLAGRLGILAAFLVLSFTVVFGAIALAYVFFGAMDKFSGVDQRGATAILSGLVSDPREYRLFMGWHALFLILVIWVSIQGVVKGLERTLRVVVPGTLLLMLGLFALAAWHGRIGGAVSHILEMHPEDVTLESVKAALFHAFFTLGLGMGVWAIFGAYTAPDTQLKRSILAVVLMDTLVAIIAGMMIFAVATDGSSFDGERGFGLLFVSLPVTLGQLPASQFVIATVFLMVVMIVWTTSLALMEPVVGWFREWTGAPRGWSALIVGLMVWFAGLASLLSFNIWADDRFAGATVFRWLELITGGLLIPAVAILISVFTGWRLTRSLSHRILGQAPAFFAAIWFWVMRLVLPVVVAYIGIQYTTFSLTNLCDSGSDGIWCGQPATVLSEIEGEAVLGERAPDTSVPQAATEEGGGQPMEPPAEKPRSGNQPTKESVPGENAPKDGDILYHSV
ncbi:sodium-dependent transporter [Marinobacter sp. F4206]|uniref:sodium-dependent transporter n=1 Tax=Marinobacter sp. F4206 TaxID=2861777 RepID=UPI001C5F004F|nr:sodium-dependent transporter [Marinobacter sp. F4206]MBW4934454.1 sodium-dependent transporter [Marinobacter sp. F4206]